MIDPDVWAAYVRDHLVMCHVTSKENVDEILEHGLRPGSEVGRSLHESYFETRAGRVYLVCFRDTPVIDVRGEPATLQIDLTQANLDPALIGPDEDFIPDQPGSPRPERRFDQNGTDSEGQDGALANWAQDTPGFDDTANTEESLRLGRISYFGSIAPVAIAELEIPSPPLSRFRDTLTDGLAAGIPVPPPRSNWKTEVARARALASATIAGACEALGAPGLNIPLDPEHAFAAERPLRELAMDHYRSGRNESGNAATALIDVVKAVGVFHGYAAVSDMDTAGDVGAACAYALDALGAAPGCTGDAARTATKASRLATAT